MNYKHTFAVEMVPVCKDDLCVLPPKLANLLGQIGTMCVVYRVTNYIYLVDPLTLQVAVFFGGWP